MKTVILGDLHAGVRDGNAILMEHQLDVLDKIIDWCVENGVKVIIQTGDVFDVRRSTNTFVLDVWKERFFNRLAKLKIQLITYIGNHDMYFKNTIRPNTIVSNLGDYNNIQIIEKPTTINLDGTDIAIIPWICEENHDECMKLIRESDAPIIFGHFEVKGAMMEGGECTDGLPISTFSKYEKCISGHFHVKGTYDNINFVGTNYGMTWGDYGIPKGFHVLDTDDLSLEFHENTETMFVKIIYDEDNNMDLELEQDLTNKSVKVVIQQREDFKKYEAWVDKLSSKNMAKLGIIEPFQDRSEADVVYHFSGEADVESTEDLIKAYVEEAYPERKTKLTQIMLAVHNEARAAF